MNIAHVLRLDRNVMTFGIRSIKTIPILKSGMVRNLQEILKTCRNLGTNSVMQVETNQ